MDFDKYDCLRYELFEILLPKMLHTGTEEEKSGVLQALLIHGGTFVYDMFAQMCEQDDVPCLYNNSDFQVHTFERGGIHFVQILLPEIDTSVNNILRAYILYSKKDNQISRYKYFLIKEFMDNGKTHIIHANSEKRGLLGEDLTDHKGDMDYEYWKLANDYSKLLIKDFRKEERELKKKY